MTISNPCGSLTDTVDVVVENPLSLNLGFDTALCQGDTLLLDAFRPTAYYQWSTGATTPSISVHQSGTYWVEIWNSCGSRKDTIEVTFLSVPTFSLPQDTFICSQGGIKQLSIAIPPFHTATWSNGSTGATFTATQAGTYWVTLANTCFSATDTIVIDEEDPLVMDLGPDDTLCAGSIHVLSTGITDRVVTWNDGSTGPDFFATQPGTYWATAENTCGAVSDTITLAFQDAPVFPVSDTVVCLNDSAKLTIPTFEGTFVWADGDTSRTRNIWEAGTYTAFLTNVCGTFPRDFQVRKTNCDCDIFMANAFTPNGDGLNDRYVPGYTCEIRSFELRIFDRWGNQIFMATTPDETWDGTYRGQPVEQGIYTYKLFYIWDVYGEYFMREKTGRIAVIR